MGVRMHVCRSYHTLHIFEDVYRSYHTYVLTALVWQDIGDAIIYAMTRKPHCAVNDIIVEPTLASI